MPTQHAVDHTSAPAAAAPPVSCDFGPFGAQTNVKLETLQAQKLCRVSHVRPETHLALRSLTAQFLPESHAHVFNAGASVWGLDWCPIHPDDRPRTYVAHTSDKKSPLTTMAPDGAYKYYLAVAPFPSRTHSPGVGVKVARPSRACVQLWSFGPSACTEGPDDNDDKGEMRCEMVLCVDSGPALELKWCPLPSHDSVRCILP